MILNPKAELRDCQLDQAIVTVAYSGVPIRVFVWGQMWFDMSFENECHTVLGIIPGALIPIPRRRSSARAPRKIPHAGRPELELAPDRNSWAETILSGASPGKHVYFVLSFMVSTKVENWSLAPSIYQGALILVAVRYDNFLAVHFNPGRSGSVGLEILRWLLAR